MTRVCEERKCLGQGYHRPASGYRGRGAGARNALLGREGACFSGSYGKRSRAGTICRQLRL